VTTNLRTPVRFKDTEIGPLPTEWEVDQVSHLAIIRTGARNTQDRVDDGAYPFFVRSQKVERINSYSYDGEAVLTAGDGVGTGKIFHYIVGRFDVHQRVYRISDFSPHIDGHYFFYQFSSRFYDRVISMTAKSSVDSVRLDMIAEMRIPVPPLAEQRAIASALSETESLITYLDALIAKKRVIKQGVIQQLLTGEVRLPGFTAAWKEATLGEIGTFFKGRGISTEEVVDTGLPCIRYGELYTHYRNYVAELVSRISAVTAAVSVPITAGDILFAGSGETAEDIATCAAYIGKEKAYAGGDVIVLRPLEQDPVFLGHLLNSGSVAKQKARLCQGEVIVHINSTRLASIRVSIPEKDEQHAIGVVLLDLDAEVAELERDRKKLESVKRGMMQSLLTGRVRLIEPAPPFSAGSAGARVGS
jgi:type I restriction enzyme, S subunit